MKTPQRWGHLYLSSLTWGKHEQPPGLCCEIYVSGQLSASASGKTVISVRMLEPRPSTRGSSDKGKLCQGKNVLCSVLPLPRVSHRLVQYLGTNILVRAQSSESCGAHYRCRMQNPTLDTLNQHLYHASHHVLPCTRVPEILLCDESIFYLSLNFC